MRRGLPPLLALLAACAPPAAPPDAPAPGAVQLRLALDAPPPGLTTAYLRLDPVDAEGATIEQTRDLVGGAASFLLWGVAPGEWLVLLEGRDRRGATLLCGRAFAQVVAGATADVPVRLRPASICELGEIDCGDGRDEDRDGRADCADSDCLGARCDDGDLCTVDDVCTDEGTCGGDPNPCDDGVECTDDGCNPITGCVNTPINGRCDDGVDCTLGFCERVTGCRFEPQDNLCHDASVCTADRCDPAQGCVHEPIPACCESDLDCDDADPCTVDACVANACRNTPDPACELVCCATAEGLRFVRRDACAPGAERPDEACEAPCAEEGATVPDAPDAPPCCPGLAPIGCDAPDDEGVCPGGCVGAFVCARCGDGECGPGENPCSCPQDCEAVCVPDCEGRVCGPDPRCGVSCGTCDDRNACTWDVCDDAGQCDSVDLDVAEWRGPAEGALTVQRPAPFVGLVMPLRDARLLLEIHCLADRVVAGTLLGEAAVPGFGVGTVELTVDGVYDPDAEDVVDVHALRTDLDGFVTAPVWGRFGVTGTLDGDLAPERGDRLGGPWTGATVPEAVVGAVGEGSWSADLACFPGSLDCSGEWFCADAVDNDGDGRIDCDDADCLPVCGPQCQVGADCDDGLDCTIDICAGGVCAHDDRPCQCEGDGDCEDGVACTVDTCEARMCVRDDAACECRVDADCAADQVCDRRVCRDPPDPDRPYAYCDAQAPCLGGACLASGPAGGGVCAPFCADDGDCPAFAGGEVRCDLEIPIDGGRRVCLLYCPELGQQSICAEGLLCVAFQPGVGVCSAPRD